jgi:hypothetical protein
LSESEPQPPAEITFRTGYAGMIEAMRNRAAARRIAITSADVAATAGLASHYIAKLLTPSKNPVRRVGMISLGPLLGILQAKLLLVPDPEAEKLYGARIPQRQESCVHNGVRGVTTEIRFSHKKFRQIQAKGRRSRWDNMSPKQRSAWARKLNRFRWAKAEAAKRQRSTQSPSPASEAKRKRPIGSKSPLQKIRAVEE